MTTTPQRSVGGRIVRTVFRAALTPLPLEAILVVPFAETAPLISRRARRTQGPYGVDSFLRVKVTAEEPAREGSG